VQPAHLLFVGGIAPAVQAIPAISTHFFVTWSVCLSVCLSSVCDIRAPCLNRSTDLDAIWQVHYWGPMTHYVTWGPRFLGKGRFGVEPQPQRAIANCSQTVCPMLPPGEYKGVVGCTCHSDSAFCQITLVLVHISVELPTRSLDLLRLAAACKTVA